MNILCVGHITYDTTFPTDSFPKENTKVRYHEKTECAGGPAAIAAFLLGKWGQNVSIAGLLGNDEYGKKIKNEFSLNRVNTSNLVLDENTETSHSLILANRTNGSRTILMYVPKYANLNPFNPNEKPDIILLDGHEYEASKELIKKYPDVITVIDADRDKKEVVELAKEVKHLVCSKNFAEKVTGIKIDFNDKLTLVQNYTKMETMFKNNIVITLEENGLLYKHNNQIKIMPSVKVKTIDSTGAGDIFHGAFVYGLANKFEYEKTLRFAVLASALSVTRVGSYKSIPTLEEMNDIYDEIK